MEQAAAGTPVAHRTPAVAPLWRDRTLAVLSVAVVLATLFHLADLGGQILQTVVVWIGLLVLHGVLLIYSRRITRYPDLPRIVRRYWRAMVFAGGLYFIGDLVQLVAIAQHPLDRGSTSGVPFQIACVDVGTVLIVGILLTSPLGFASSKERFRFWLDTATVMVAAAAFGWYFSIVPGSHLYDGRSQFQAMHDLLFGPVVMLVGMFVVVKVLLSGGRPFTRLAGTVLAAAAGVEGVAQSVTESLLGEHIIGVVFALTLLANGLLSATAIVQQHQMTADPHVLQQARKRPYSLLPYGAIAATYGLLVVVLRNSGLDVRAWLVLGAAIVSTSLVVVRQIAAFTENTRLLAELDAKVRERDQLAAALHHQAFHDPLTGLANRALFADRLEADLARGRRAGTSTAVMLVDLDNFKPVNDRLGHRAGDDLLQEIARRLLHCVRETDTIARLGGDEFAVLLEHPLGEGVHAVAERIIESVREPFVVSDEIVAVGASVGVAIGRAGECTADSLLNDADVAMYRAKDRGKGAYEISPNSRFDRRHTPPGGLAAVNGQTVAPPPQPQPAAGTGPRRRRTDRYVPDPLAEDARGAS
jgi:diguanylate cyclase (GGDEF)-like protein